MTPPRRLIVIAFALLLSLAPGFGPSHAAGEAGLRVVWQPPVPRVGEVAWLAIRGAEADAVLDGSVNGRPLAFFPYGDGHAALVGFDVDVKPGKQEWRIVALTPEREPLRATGTISVKRRDFQEQRLTLPTGMVNLDPETERRAESEGQRLRTLYRMVTPERLWRGRFVRPVAGAEPGTGFGARRIINGQPRAPHTGADYAAPRGTSVVAANDARVALVGDYFFPGRLVVLDHGLGMYTLYFHLDEVKVLEGERVTRGEPIGTVGATGRATGPHLHFGAMLGSARIDPAALLQLSVRD